MTPALSTVSIIITNFNYANFVIEAIDSALDQTYENVEVIVVDDGSTDASREVISGYGDRVIPVFKENGGQGSSMNAGYQASHGEIVFFLDADDLLEPQIVERVVAAFDEHPDAIKVQFRMQEVDAEGVPTGGILPRHRRPFLTGDLRNYFLRHHMYTWPWTSGSAYRSALLAEVMPIPDDVFTNDCDGYLAHTTVMIAPIVSLDEIGCSYRIHESNDSSVKTFSLDRTRSGLKRLHDGHPYLKRVADAQGFSEFPASVDGFRNLNVLVPRITSYKLDPRNHPFSSDNAVGLFRKAVAASIGNPELTVKYRIGNVIWAGAVLFSPRPLARKLCDLRRSIAVGG